MKKTWTIYKSFSQLLFPLMSATVPIETTDEEIQEKANQYVWNNVDKDEWGLCHLEIVEDEENV